VAASGSSRAPETRRELDLFPAIALVVGHTIAVGIFLTPAEVIGALGSPRLTISLWIAAGGLVLAGAFSFGELASRYPQSGGLYVYLREAWGDRVAFLYGWQSLLVMDPGVTAALATGLSGYVAVVWPAAAGAERWMATACIWVAALLSIAGLTLSGRVLTALTAFKLLALIAVVVLVLAAGDGSWSHFAPRPEPARAGTIAGALPLAIVAVFFSFGGFWEASRVAGEVRRARRTVPIAFVVGIGCVTVVYVMVTTAFIYAVQVDEVTSGPELARRVGVQMLGRAGPPALALVVVLSALVSIMALLIVAPRLYLAMETDDAFPPALASINRATRTPARATAMLAILATGFVFLGTFQQIVAFFMCTTLTFVALAAAALLVVRRRSPRTSPFSAPLYPLTPIVFVTFVAGVVVLVAASQPFQSIAGFALVVLGLPARKLTGSRRAARSHRYPSARASRLP
jgi:APA family basic amino acid/polyamine antiporter